MTRANHPALLAEYIQILNQEGEKLQSTDLYIPYLQRFLKHQYSQIFSTSNEVQPLIFVSSTISPVLGQSRGQIVFGTPTDNLVQYFELKKNEYYLTSCPHNLLSGQLLKSKDPNIPIYMLNIKSGKEISRKKVSIKLINKIKLQMKILTISYGIGVLEGLQTATVNHAHIRKSNDVSLISHNNISYQLANNLIQLSKLKAVFRNCLERLQAGDLNSMTENVLMYLNDQTHQIVIDSAMQIFGAQSMKADTLPALAIKRSFSLRSLTENKTTVTHKIKSVLLKKSQSKNSKKNIYSIEGL